MKKIIAIALILVMTLSFVGCGATEVPDKTYTLDKDILQENLFNVIVEGDRDAFNSVYAVTDETYDALMSEIVSKDIITDYIVFLPETEWTNYIFFAFQTENPDEVNSAMTQYFDTYKTNKWLSDDQVSIFAESDWYVWSVSLDADAVIEIVKSGAEKDVMEAELLALKESFSVFGANMPSSLDDEYFVFEGMLEKSDLTDMYVLNSTIIGVNPLMMFKPAEGCEDTVKDMMTTWQQSQLDTMSWYQPNLVPIIESMELIEQNGYLIYIINEYPDETKTAIESAWVEIA